MLSRVVREVLRGALERDGGEMTPPGLETDRESERHSRLPADESLWRGAPGASRPPRVGLEARSPVRRVRARPWRLSGC